MDLSADLFVRWRIRRSPSLLKERRAKSEAQRLESSSNSIETRRSKQRPNSRRGHPERSEGSRTRSERHTICVCVINDLLRDPSLALGMTPTALLCAHKISIPRE